jgi:hypothetical protein
VTGRLEKIAWLHRICIPCKYFCVNEMIGGAMGVIHGIGVKDEKIIPNISGKT